MKWLRNWVYPGAGATAKMTRMTGNLTTKEAQMYKDRVWYKIDQLRKKRDFTQIEFVKGYLTSESSMERESAWDYLRSARHFTIALVSQARTAANDDDSRCTRAAAKQYLTANG